MVFIVNVSNNNNNNNNLLCYFTLYIYKKECSKVYKLEGTQAAFKKIVETSRVK